ncbi:MAG: hypothetical protein EOP13_00315 [Pseudomonas sp.]|uniref:hypothetical protein n=1 Tax=Pseudomonas sp. TaxID=306 RepID=UPI00121845A0|nr:hypothetical protein [Pseudomonas sp.]RZI76964.1 MAG: hypothetical protein EOP13_00315 [Pseudomonas sp.]
MSLNPDDPRRSARPSKRIIWIIGGVLIVIAALVALQGIVRGTGEAVGVDEAAPGGANATPAAGTDASQ